MVISQAYYQPGLHLNPELIFQVVSDVYGIDRERLFKDCNRRPLPEARMVCFLITMNLFNFTCIRVGMLTSRDHSTVLNGIKKIKQLASVDENVLSSIMLCGIKLGIREDHIREWLND